MSQQHIQTGRERRAGVVLYISAFTGAEERIGVLYPARWEARAEEKLSTMLGRVATSIRRQRCWVKDSINRRGHLLGDALA